MDWFGISGLLAVVIPIIVTLLKKVPRINTKHAPICAFGLGLLGGAIGFWLNFTPSDMTMLQALLTGAAIGGTSTGLYDLKHQYLDK